MKKRTDSHRAKKEVEKTFLAEYIKWATTVVPVLPERNTKVGVM